MRKLILIIAMAFPFFQSNAQSIEKSKNNTGYYKPSKSLSPSDFFNESRDYFKLSPGTKFQEIVSSAKNHKKYKQHYNDLEIFGSSLHLHLKNNLVDYITGHYYKNVNVNMEAKLSEEMALNSSLYLFTGKKQKQEITAQKNSIKKEISKVIIPNSFPKRHGQLKLAYQIILTDDSYHKKHEYFIDAINGSLIFDQSKICHIEVPGKGKSYHYGEKQFIVDSLAPSNFVLRDGGRNISTTSDIIGLDSDEDKNWEFGEKDKKGAIIDAHYCASRFYDMMFDKHSYRGLDGNGSELKSLVLLNDDFVNAYWDGNTTAYGRGDCHYGPLTTLSIVAHEFTHGVTQFNSELIYADESGALNEAFSDVFGKALEYYEDKANFSWELDLKIKEDEFSQIFRNMADPKSVMHPAFYKGEYWQDGADVHTNSSILNLWFVMLVDGKEGENENGDSYKVDKMNIDEVLKILFKCQTEYLNPSSDYNEMYDYTMLVCKDLFGENSTQFSSLSEAWKAVGLPNRGNGGSNMSDIGIRTEFSFQSECGELFSSINVPVIVLNNGMETINANTVLRFEIDNDPSNVIEHTLLTPIMSGEEVEIELENAILIEYMGFQFINLRLMNNDENDANNSTFYFTEVFSSSPDFALAASTIEHDDCNIDKLKCNISLINNTCYTVSINSPVFITIMAEGEEISKEEIMLSSFTQGLPETFSIKIDKMLDDFSEIEVVIENADETNIEDNSQSIEYKKSIISEIVNYNCEDSKSFEEFRLPNEARMGYQFKGESYLKIEPNFTSPPCKSLEDFNPTSSTSVCLDLKNFQLPRLSFDLIQIRGDLTENPELVNNSNVLVVKYESNDNNFVEEIYANFIDEVKSKKEIFLPSNYKGKLILDFYLASMANDFAYKTEKSDIILIDNFIIEDITNTNDQDLNNQLSIYPNPASQMLYIISKSEGVYEITDINGKIITKSSLPKDKNLDLSNFHSGLYFLKFQDMKGQKEIRKFVKI